MEWSALLALDDGPRAAALAALTDKELDIATNGAWMAAYFRSDGRWRGNEIATNAETHSLRIWRVFADEVERRRQQGSPYWEELCF